MNKEDEDVFVKPDEQNQACSGSAMARNRVLKRKEYDT